MMQTCYKLDKQCYTRAHIHIEKYVDFHCNSSDANAPQYYVIDTLPVLF